MDETACENILVNFLIIYWKQRQEWIFIYKGLKSHEFRMWRWHWKAGAYCSFTVLAILLLCFFFLFSNGQLFHQNIHFLKRQSSCVPGQSLTCMFIQNLEDFKPKTELWFRFFVEQSTIHSEHWAKHLCPPEQCSGEWVTAPAGTEEGVKLIFQSTDRWHIMGVMWP